MKLGDRHGIHALADRIVHEIRPRKVLDASGGSASLVQHLRENGIEAFGCDLSPATLERIPEAVRAHCSTASLVEPICESFDLVVCGDALARLAAEDLSTAVANVCAASDDVFVSATAELVADGVPRPLRPFERWASHFGREDFVRDLEFDPDLLTGFARFRRRLDPWPRVASGYERNLARDRIEIGALRDRVASLSSALAEKERREASGVDVESLERTIAEQESHLAALGERIEYLSDRENELRALLYAAHEQLLERDEKLRGHGSNATVTALERSVAERTAESAERLEIIRRLEQTVGERTAWAEGLLAEAEKRLEIIHRQRDVIEDLRRSRFPIGGKAIVRLATRLRGFLS
jgi:hypothetical protein